MGELRNFLDDDVQPPRDGLDLGSRRNGRSIPLRTVVWLLVGATLLAGLVGYGIGRAGRPAIAEVAPASSASVSQPNPTVDMRLPTPAASTGADDSTAQASPTPGLSQPDHLALLETLEIKGRAPLTGYERETFFGPAWEDVDGNGCRTRDDILRRDLVDLVLQEGTGGCAVSLGVLHDPYTGNVINFVKGQGTSELVQIDHVVALADAWQKGAQQWTQETRVAFANDPLNLLAVDGAANQQKGAGDAATWLPANRAYWCEYAQRIVEVKAAYGVWTTAAENQRLGELLDRC